MLSQKTTDTLNQIAGFVHDFVQTLPTSARPAVQAAAQAALNEIATELYYKSNKEIEDVTSPCSPEGSE